MPRCCRPKAANWCITSRWQLDNLPLLTVGATNDGLRDYFAASRLLPGIQYSDSGTHSAVVSAMVNGTPSNTLQTCLDGATMNPTSLRLLGATMETQPSADSIQEVAILTSNFPPSSAPRAVQW
jgi:hypothetical protein